MKPKTEAVYPQHRGRQQARRGHPAAQSERLPERGLVSRPAADLGPSRPPPCRRTLLPLTPSPSLSPPSPQSLGCTMAAGSTVDQTTHILNIVCMPLAEDLGNVQGFGRADEDLADEGGRSHGPPAPRPAPRSAANRSARLGFRILFDRGPGCSPWEGLSGHRSGRSRVTHLTSHVHPGDQRRSGDVLPQPLGLGRVRRPPSACKEPSEAESELVSVQPVKRGGRRRNSLSVGGSCESGKGR